MPTPPHFLLGLVSLSIVVAMPEPPTYPPFPPSDGRTSHDQGDYNMTYPMDGVDGAAEAYCHMLMEGPVPPRPDQMPWFCVCTWCKGTQGPKGDQGDRGLPGAPGSPGRRGLTGPRGRPGFVGRQGIKGQKGDEGLKGDRGPEGAMGPKGDNGFKGEKGERGVEGRPGDQGPKGDDGVCPDSCESTQGLPGPPGLPGPAGPRGMQGLKGSMGSQGLKGDPGVAGPRGNPGSVGEKGEPGVKGDCNCEDGLSGSPGQKGDKGDKGDQGQQGPSGQRGSQGEKGDMGSMGMMGPPGPCMPFVQSAFSAGLVENFPPPNLPVVFSRVFYNVQGNYDSSSGIYTAPINGTYVFSYHCSVYERVLKVGLFHNFVPVVKTTTTHELGTTSNQLVLHLARGDTVWIMVKDGVTNGMSALSESSSTFSGFLLHPDRCDAVMLRDSSPLSPVKGDYSWDPATTTVSPAASSSP